MNIKRFLREITSKWIDSHPTIQIALSLAGFLLFYELLKKGL